MIARPRPIVFWWPVKFYIKFAAKLLVDIANKEVVDNGWFQTFANVFYEQNKCPSRYKRHRWILLAFYCGQIWDISGLNGNYKTDKFLNA